MVQLVNNRSPQSTVVTSVTAVNSLQTAVADDRSCPANVKREIENEERPSSCKKAKFMSPYQQQIMVISKLSLVPKLCMVPLLLSRGRFLYPANFTETLHDAQQWSAVSSAAHSQSAYFNPLDEPSPLGLRLRKTPSLLDLIQMKLSQGDPICSGDTNSLKQDVGKRKDSRSAAAQASADKLKASNFPVSILRIGTWEVMAFKLQTTVRLFQCSQHCISRYEGDLVAKCYFAKHKLVWEVLDGGLKSKIEIQWSDIIALKASCPENEPGVLDIEVSRSPLFFRETNPQPRKHTLWQATSDFTGGQATVCKDSEYDRSGQNALEMGITRNRVCYGSILEFGVKHVKQPPGTGATRVGASPLSRSLLIPHAEIWLEGSPPGPTNHSPIAAAQVGPQTIPGVGIARESGGAFYLVLIWRHLADCSRVGKDDIAKPKGTANTRSLLSYLSLKEDLSIGRFLELAHGNGTDNYHKIVEHMDCAWRHFLQCPQGLLNKHYEKLIQCDPRLNLLSKKSVISRDSPYFDSRSAAFQDQDEQASYRTIQEDKSHLLPQLDHLRNEYLTPFPGFQDAAPPVAQTVVPKCEPLDPEDRMLEATSKETPSPSSVMDSRAIEENGNSDNDELNMKGATQWEQLRFSVPLSDFLDQGSGMALSTSMSTLVNQIGLCFQEQRRSCNSLSTGEGTWSSNKKMLDEIAQHLLGDSLLSANSDEQSIIARVNSLCSLLQKDVSTVHASQPNTGNAEESVTGCGLGRLNQGEDGKVEDEADDKRAAISTKGDHDPVYLIESSAVDCKPVIPRKESSGDLLLHLPRIASLPQFFVHASDELVMRNEPHGTVGGNRFR
eukprot:Gb_40861 [translate_table: standard]